MLAAMFTFDRMLSSLLVKVVYWLGLLVIGGATLLSLLGALMSLGDSPGGALGTVVVVAVLAPVAVLLWRLFCESAILLFGIYDRLGEIRDQLGGAQRLSAK